MNQKGWSCFLELCSKAQSMKILPELLDLLLTPEERSSLATRCLVIQLLMDHKKTQRQISQELNVSIAKITRGSNELKRISKKLQKFLQEQ